MQKVRSWNNKPLHYDMVNSHKRLPQLASTLSYDDLIHYHHKYFNNSIVHAKRNIEDYQTVGLLTNHTIEYVKISINKC